MLQVAREFTLPISPSLESFDSGRLKSGELSEASRRETLVNSIVHFNDSVVRLNRSLAKRAKQFNTISPRDFIDFIGHFLEEHRLKKERLEEQQEHLRVGLGKLKESEASVLSL